MGKKLHIDPAAEKEAIDIGAQFMHSTDVVGDMSRAYGRDLSAVRIHTDESAARSAAERGVDAYSTGKDVFFARGAFDRSDPASRGLLAHELSHSLQQGVGGSAPAMEQTAPEGAAQGGLVDWFRRIFHRRGPEKDIRFTDKENSPAPADIGRFFTNGNTIHSKARFADPRRGDLFETVSQRMSSDPAYGDGIDNILENASGSVSIRGLNTGRLLTSLAGPLGGDLSSDDISGLYEKLQGGQRYAQLRDKATNGGLNAAGQAEMDSYTPQQIAGMDATFDEGMGQLKGIQLAQLRRLKDKYGIYGSQMHPEDFLTRIGPEFFADTALLQDTSQMMVDGGRYFDYENNPDDQEYKTLSDYFNDVFINLQGYILTNANMANDDAFMPDEFMLDQTFKPMDAIPRAENAEAAMRALGAKGFSPKEQHSYTSRLRKRLKSKGLGSRLFGRFL